MTVALSKPTTQWGVRFSGSVNRDTHVTTCSCEADAGRFCNALHYMGNGDAELVTRPDAGSDWVLAVAS